MNPEMDDRPENIKAEIEKLEESKAALNGPE